MLFNSYESIPELLEREFSRCVRSAAQTGYSPIIYKDYAKLFHKTPHKPRVAVIPINMRSFSDEWYKKRFYHFRLRKERILREVEGIDF